MSRKNERFHRTLKAQVPQGPPIANLQQAQAVFDHWCGIDNQQRLHQALDMREDAHKSMADWQIFGKFAPL